MLIDEIYLEENVVKIMGPCDPVEPFYRLIKKLEKGREFEQAGGKMVSNAIMVSKGITLLLQTDMFNKYIREWIHQTTDLKTW